MYRINDYNTRYYLEIILTELTLTIILDEAYYAYSTILTMVILIVFTTPFNPQ